MRILKWLLFLFLLSTGLTPTVITAQARTTLVIAVPEWWKGQFDEAIFDAFEAQHTSVDVVVNYVANKDMFYPPPQTSIYDHIYKAFAYAAKGDVLFTGSHQLYVETTRSGAFLDLAPLVATDTNLDTGDFHPAMWQSFQWDGGVWGIPVGGTLLLNVYDKTAFDESNVPYPDTNWTITDYVTHIPELTTYKNSGIVDTPGFNSYHVLPLFYSLLNQSLYDASVFPEVAHVMSDESIEILTAWTTLLDEKVANPFGMLDYDLNQVPLHVDSSWRVTSRYMSTASDWKVALLPNNHAGLQVEGFSVSSGTDYPELAYDLIMYLTQQPEIVNYYSFDMLARQSMSGVENENTSLVFGERSPELDDFLNQAIQSAIPVAEMRYYNYFDYAIQLIQHQHISVDDALIAAQKLLDENLKLAVELGENQQVFVEVPLATPVMEADEIMLNFGMDTLITPLPNQDQWDRVVQEFVDTDAEVGDIFLNFGMGTTEEYDCFYRQYNNLRSLSIENILPMEPFLNADPNFDRDDISPQVLAQMTRDNQLWGMPMNMTPNILWVNERRFNEAGIPIPDTQWTINDFIDALNQLDALTADAPFSSRTYGSTYILNLIAASGGLPVDPTQPDAIPDLTSDQTIGAIRQILDLAKAGLIEYDVLADLGYSSRGGITVDQVPIYGATLSAIDFRFQQRRNGAQDNSRAVLFPSGTAYTPMTMEVGGGYINASTPYADACYRWIAYLAQNPELFDGMPARRSQLETTRLQGEDLYDLYVNIDVQMNQPNTVIFPFVVVGASAFHYQQWMFRAFDDYVLNDVPLEAALADAQQFIDAYAQCVEPIEPISIGGLSRQEINDYISQFTRCAAAVDPIFADMYDTTS